MSNITTDNFWQQLWIEYGEQYQAQSTKPSFSDFQVWADEHNLVPEFKDE